MKNGEKSRYTEYSALRALALVGQLGLVMALPIVAGVAGGVWLDRYLETGGIVLAAMLFLGLAVGAAGVWRILKQELPPCRH
jgi:ATP synthase protein I